MKSKYFLIKVSGIVFLIMIILLYFLLYFLPTIKDISRYKRELKDMNLKVSDFVKMETAFTYSDNNERQLLEESVQELTGKIPVVNSREEFIALFTTISNYVKNVAKNDGIYNLVITSDSKELKVTAGSLSTDKKSLNDLLSFSSQRLNNLKKQTDFNRRNTSSPTNSDSGANPDAQLEKLVPGIKYHTVWLSFSSELPGSMQFINHLPWSNYFLTQDKMIITTGDMTPYYLVSLRIYYIDRTSGQPQGNTQ